MEASPRGAADESAGDLSPALVREQLDRLLADSRFNRSERLSRFLRYTVEQTLSGAGDGLKEYTIALEVYDKAPSYDPSVDSVVRVEVRRLRAKLSDYYENTGRNDPLRIEFPKGYVPVFIRQVPVVPAGLERDAADSKSFGEIELPVAVPTAAPGRYRNPVLIFAVPSSLASHRMSS